MVRSSYVNEKKNFYQRRRRRNTTHRLVDTKPGGVCKQLIPDISYIFEWQVKYFYFCLSNENKQEQLSQIDDVIVNTAIPVILHASTLRFFFFTTLRTVRSHLQLDRWLLLGLFGGVMYTWNRSPQGLISLGLKRCFIFRVPGGIMVAMGPTEGTIYCRFILRQSTRKPQMTRQTCNHRAFRHWIRNVCAWSWECDEIRELWQKLCARRKKGLLVPGQRASITKWSTP